jgi:hypothetical protein
MSALRVRFPARLPRGVGPHRFGSFTPGSCARASRPATVRRLGLRAIPEGATRLAALFVRRGRRLLSQRWTRKLAERPVDGHRQESGASRSGGFENTALGCTQRGFQGTAGSGTRTLTEQTITRFTKDRIVDITRLVVHSAAEPSRALLDKERLTQIATSDLGAATQSADG